MNTLLRLLGLLRPQLGLMVLGALLSIITIFANISLLAVSGWFLTLMAIAGAQGLSVNYFTPAAVIRFLAIVRSAGRYAERLLTHRATFNLLASLRHHFYQQLEPLLPYYRLDLRSGDLLARLQSDVDQLDNFYLRVALPILVALISVPLLCFIIGMMSVVIGWVMLMALLTVGVFLPLISFYLARKKSLQYSQFDSSLKLELVSGIAALKELLVFQVTHSLAQSVGRLSDRLYRLKQRLVHVDAMLTAVTFVITHFVAIGCLLWATPYVVSGAFDAKVIAGLTLLILVSFETVMALPLALQTLPMCLASASRLFEIIDRPVPQRGGEQKLVVGNIVFNHFNFKYPGQAALTLKNISLTIKSGDKVAIIGASGAGKSTLVNVLMGFWPTRNLSIADVALDDIDQQSLRDNIALMSQQGHLFDATIADNLRLANSGATEQEMLAVCDNAGLSDFIALLPNGLNTWLGETGSGLSGGQAQRLQFAQLLLRPANILILDEPTKGLDGVSEQRLMNSLLAHANKQHKTLIVITHKPLMLQKMDSIVLLEQGEITAQGGHQQLVESNAYYRQLLNYF